MSIPLSREHLRALAPVELENFRQFRYDGDQMCLSIETFVAEEQDLIHKFYNTLGELLALLRQEPNTIDEGLARVEAFLNQLEWTAFIGEIQRLGSRTRAVRSHPLLEQVLHDIKGGGFMALSVYLQLIEMGIAEREDFPRLLFLTRDHMKIMRNVIQDLDRERQERDRQKIDHGVDLLIEKWDQAVHQLRGAQAEVVLDYDFAGTISESCLEFSALDRVLYNLINNAARHTADGKVYFAIVPVPTKTAPRDLRFVIYNATASAHQQVLTERYGTNLGELFRGGFTTGGNGLGLRICADFVNNAYGMVQFDHGLQEGYFGATHIDGYFVNWVHWPLVAD